MLLNSDKFKLSKAEHEAVYAIIEELAFDGTNQQRFPQAIILGGQPGAGKSGLLDESYQEFSSHDVVKINGDDFRQFHPEIEQIIIFDESNMAVYTDPDVRSWTKRLFDTTIETRRNVIFEGTMRESGAITNTMKRLMDSGYSVTARVMAVHARQSVAGVFQRFESQKEDNGHGRMAPLSVHDQAYQGLLETVRYIEDNKLANKIQIYNRSGDVIHEAKLVDGNWDIPGADKAISAHRAIVPTIEQCRDYMDDWADTFSRMKRRNASEEEINYTRDVAAPFLSELYPILAEQKNIISRIIDTNKMKDLSGIRSVDLSVEKDIQIEFAGKIDKYEDPEPSR
jgi:predicted ABC-type ATPase